jgi:hypothetical protein
LLGTASGPLASAFFYVFAIKEFPSLAHILHPLYIAALVWSVAGLYFLGRGMWSRPMPGDAGLTTGLEFCREEIDCRRRLLRRLLVWSLGPILLVIATFIVALALIATKDRGIFPNGLPFLAVVAAWIFYYFVLRVREQRELERELEELNRTESA